MNQNVGKEKTKIKITYILLKIVKVIG